jgi:NADH-quinone oxidoreductase subunit L
MVVRCGAIFALSPLALTVIAVIVVVTAFFAAVIALAQTDIKRILAYSTISQLGYMFLAVGVGAAGAAIFHLYTHAFFKALLFLAAGTVMHALNGRIDLHDLGGLKKDLPWTRSAFLIGALALSGVPLFSGFFSKDEILVAALNHPALSWLGWLALLTAALTAFYIFRCYFLAFHGPRRLPADVAHPHEAPVMTFSLVILALGAIFAGYVNVGGQHPFATFLARSESLRAYADITPHVHHFAESTISIVAAVVVILGIALAASIYLRRAVRLAPAAAKFSLRQLLARKFYIDELYDLLLIRPLRALGHTFAWDDNVIIDSLLWLIAAVPRALGGLFRLTQRGRLQTYALLSLALLALIVFLLLTPHQ